MRCAPNAKKVVVLAPGAPWRLKRCLARQLGAAKWKKRPRYYKTRYASAVRFRKAKKKTRKIKKTKR